MGSRFRQTMEGTIEMNFGILMGLVILCLGPTVLTNKSAIATNFFNVVRQITINLYLACGITFVILLDGIDLSADSVIAITGCASADMIAWVGPLVPVGILTNIPYGTLVGAPNGTTISRITIPAFIVILATMNIGRGIARVYTHAQTIAVLDDPYTFWGMGSILGLPVQLYLIIAVVVLIFFILNRTGFDRHIYVTGGSKIASEYSGISIKRVTFFMFILGGFLAPLANVLTVGGILTVTMIVGDGAEMGAIAVVVLGGTSVSGGKGNISGMVIGIIVIGILKNGVNLPGVDSS